MNLSIVIPAFNEEKNIIPLYQRLISVVTACSEVAAFEIVIVNDGSTDGTSQKLSSIPDSRLKVVHFDKRRGQSAALKKGIDSTVFDTIATLDADLQNDPAELPRMIALLNQGFDFVQGWRTPRNDPKLKRISAIIANRVRRGVLKDTFHDIGCSQRIFNKQCVSHVDFFPGAHRFLPYLVQEDGYKVVESKVTHHPRHAGRSKYGLLNRLGGPLKDLIRLGLIRKSSRNSSTFRIQMFAYLSILAFLVIGMSNIHRYGYGSDEIWLLYRGERASRIVVSLLSPKGRERPPSASESEFANYRVRNELWNYHSSLEGDEMWNYHSSFYALVNYRLFSRWLNRLGMHDLPSKHFLNLIVAALALLAVFKLASEILGPEQALYALFFMMFYPRFIAHAHYNPKNIPAMAALTVSMLYSYRWVSAPRVSHLISAGCWMGVAAACCLSSLEVLPVFPLTVLLIPAESSEKPFFADSWRRFVKPCLTYLAISFLTLYLLWPNLWVNTLLLIKSIRHYAGVFDLGDLIYFGVRYARSSVPWHYYPFFLLVCTPLATWFFAGLGVWRFPDGTDKRKRDTALFMLLLWMALPLLLRMNPWVVKYNQIRHIFHVIPPLMILAGRGMGVFMNSLRNTLVSGYRRGITFFVYTSLFAYFAWQVIPIHPYEDQYFNEAFRVVYPRQIEDHFEFPVGQSAYQVAIDWLNSNANPNSVIRIPYMFYDTYLYAKRTDLQFIINGRADYTVVSGTDFSTRDRYQKMQPLFEVRRYDSRLVAIFRNSASTIHLSNNGRTEAH